MKIIEATNIEDLLEVSVGLWKDSPIKIDTSDMTIMNSIARQTFRGTALTDRQHALMQEKLLHYKSQFDKAGYDFDNSIQNLRNPIREIDRSKYIRIAKEKTFQSVYEEWIEVRFPFSKKMIMLIEEIKNGITNEKHYHEKGTHKHYFLLNDRVISLLIPRFMNKEFIIQEELIQQYNRFKNKSLFDFYPYYDGELHNIKDFQRQQIAKETDLDKFQIIDRRFRYGLHIKDMDMVQSKGIISDIITRENRDYTSNPKEQNFKQIMDSLVELDRFPLMVVLNDKMAEHQLYEFWDYFRYIIPSQQQSVMFRLDNDNNSEFNRFIKDKGLNNSLDKDTKVVYINKINKVIIKSEWKPIAAFAYDSKMDRNLNAYIYDACDLIVFREESVSPFRKYSNFYG